MVKKVRKAAQSGPRQSKTGKLADRKRKAKSPGKRFSALGSPYTETRRNRSDADRRKRI